MSTGKNHCWVCGNVAHPYCDLPECAADSPTPRTDAVSIGDQDKWVPAEFAKGLERELLAVKEQNGMLIRMMLKERSK